MKKILIALLFIFSFFVLNINSVFAQENSDGMSFDDKKHTTTKLYAEMPSTIKADIFLPAGLTSRSGVIFGNYTNSSIKNSFEIEIASGGKPRFYYNNDKGEVVDIRFNTIVNTGEWVTIAFIYDEVNEKISFYNNGILCDEIDTSSGENYSTFSKITAAALCEYYVLGGDNRTNNAQYFKGQIRTLSLYKDVKTAEELKETTNINDNDLLAHYEMDSSSKDFVEDLTGNGYGFTYCPEWINPDDKTPVTDYAYSFAVVGDTQYVGWSSSKNNDVANVTTPDRMDTLYQWIANNVESKKIKFVIGLGDITDDDTNDEWTNAASSIGKLDGLVPYSLIRGNHDTSEQFYKTFGNETYMGQFDGFYKSENINSSYKAMTIGKTNYLFLTLDYGADDAELAWAASVIEAFPTHKVVISTHSYLYRDGTTLSGNDPYVPDDSNDVDFALDKEFNDGDKMWDKLISKYANIEFVLAGHDSSPSVMNIKATGVHGNTVNQMLIDAQNMDRDIMGAVGMVCMFYFNEDGSEMQIEYYSTLRNQYYRVTNQYKVDLSGTGTSAHNFSDYYNENYHWQMCDDCGAQTEKVAHSYDNACDEKCNVCEAVRRIDGHSFTDEKSDEHVHYNECSICHTKDEVSIKAHNFDNACDEDCNECDYERSTEHDYSIPKNDGENYWKECSGCGDKLPTEAPSPEPSPDSTSGCSGNVVGTLFAAISLLGIAGLVLVLKKKNS